MVLGLTTRDELPRRNQGQQGQARQTRIASNPDAYAHIMKANSAFVREHTRKAKGSNFLTIIIEQQAQ